MNFQYNELHDYLKLYPAVLLNRRNLENILKDLFPEQTLFINVLLIAYFDIKIHDEITSSNKTDQYFVNRFAKKISSDFGIQGEITKTGITFWINCLKDIDKPSIDPISVATYTPGLRDKYFPCGVGIQDKGFYISGIKNSNKPCEHDLANVFAVIFWYLQRNLDMKPGIVYNQVENKSNQRLNYRRIYRLEMLILYLVKNNYFTDNLLEVSLFGWSEKELNIALATVNQYVQLFCGLLGISPQELQLKISCNSNLTINSSNSSSGISVFDSQTRATKERVDWLEKNLIYQINQENRDLLQILLKEAFDLDNFLEGQFEAIQEILNNENNKLCIMPTGAGKSLIYYLSVILQPSPSMILCPTRILIEDQIENLKNKHLIDDTKNLDDFIIGDEFKPSNKFIFLTPMAFLSSSLMKKVIDFNLNQKISNFILDEVHCISNWSHDFRPEYLMLSFNLEHYVDKTRLLCFTATANYTVVRDLIYQLGLDEKDRGLVMPVDLCRNNQRYIFSEVTREEDLQLEISSIITTYLKNQRKLNNQMLIFTKDKSLSEMIKKNLSEELKDEVEVFSSSNVNSYSDFACNRYRILIGDSEVGIGIDLPGVTHTTHFGVPISKSQYVQEIGRAGRDKNHAISTVLFQKHTSVNQDEHHLLNRNTPIQEIINYINNSVQQNDLVNTYFRIFGGIQNQDEYKTGVVNLLYDLQRIKNSDNIQIFLGMDSDYATNLAKQMRYFYVLFRVGYLFNWYISEHNQQEGYARFLVEISESTDLNTLISHVSEYLHNMGDYKKAVRKIKDSKSIPEIIENYISWHYSQFLYHHREQYLEMYDFLELYKNRTDNQITKSLENYFSLSMIDIKKSSSSIEKLTFRDILRIIENEVDGKMVNDIQKGIENEYTLKRDFFLFIYTLIIEQSYNNSRFERIVSTCRESEVYEIMEIVDQIYVKCSISDRFLLINTLCRRVSLLEALDGLFNRIEKDQVYYSILSKCCNYYL